MVEAMGVEVAYIVYFELRPSMPGSRPLAPTKAHAGDAGWDLYVAADVFLAPRSFTDVPTDVAVDLPPGTFGLILARSSTNKRADLRVHTSVIDNGYRGTLNVGTWNNGDEPHRVRAGERLGQLIVLPLLPVEMEQAYELRAPEDGRGERGYGSTGP